MYLDFLLIDARYWKSKSCSVVLASENETLLAVFIWFLALVLSRCLYGK